MQTQSKLFDDLAKVASGALSAASGLREEINQVVQQQIDRFMASRDLVTREDFEAVEAMAVKAREENEALANRIAALEKAVAESAAKTAGKTAAKSAAKPTTRKSAARPKAGTTSRRTTSTRRSKAKPANTDTPKSED
jgi:hypothetical protein